MCELDAKLKEGSGYLLNRKMFAVCWRLSSVELPNDERSDATDGDSSTGAWYKNLISSPRPYP